MKDDIFTSDHARVALTHAGQTVGLLIGKGLTFLQPVYGPAAAIKLQHYFGFAPRWVAGYRTELGFHVRGEGRGDVGGMAEAICQAIEGRQSSDPSPDRPALAAAGTYATGGRPPANPATSPATSPGPACSPDGGGGANQ